MKSFFAYQLGKRSKAFRLWYHKKFGDQWLWGIFQFIQDTDDGKPKEPLTTAVMEKLWENMDFSNRK